MIRNISLAQPQFSYSTAGRQNRSQSNVINFQGRICNVEKCKANCCYHVPIPRDILRKFADKVVNPIIATKPMGFNKKFGGRNVLPFTDLNPYKNKCPFLTLTNRCNIYEDRPALCKLFGSSKRADLTCRHQEITPDDIVS